MIRLHHHAIVVRDLESGSAVYRSLGAELVGQVYTDPIQEAEIAFVQVPGNTALIELVAPYSSSSRVAAFLENYGGGLHHTCYMVADLPATIERLQKSRAILVFAPQPAVAFAGRKIAFMYLRDRSLVEFVEAGSGMEPLSLLGGHFDAKVRSVDSGTEGGC